MPRTIAFTNEEKVPNVVLELCQAIAADNRFLPDVVGAISFSRFQQVRGARGDNPPVIRSIRSGDHGCWLSLQPGGPDTCFRVWITAEGLTGQTIRAGLQAYSTLLYRKDGEWAWKQTDTAADQEPESSPEEAQVDGDAQGGPTADEVIVTLKRHQAAFRARRQETSEHMHTLVEMACDALGDNGAIFNIRAVSEKARELAVSVETKEDKNRSDLKFGGSFVKRSLERLLDEGKLSTTLIGNRRWYALHSFSGNLVAENVPEAPAKRANVKTRDENAAAATVAHGSGDPSCPVTDSATPTEAPTTVEVDNDELCQRVLDAGRNLNKGGLPGVFTIETLSGAIAKHYGRQDTVVDEAHIVTRLPSVLLLLEVGGKIESTGEAGVWRFPDSRANGCNTRFEALTDTRQLLLELIDSAARGEDVSEAIALLEKSVLTQGDEANESIIGNLEAERERHIALIANIDISISELRRLMALQQDLSSLVVGAKAVVASRQPPAES